MPANIQESANHLYKTRQVNSGEISAADGSAYKVIDNEIDQIKAEILDVISGLC